MHLMKLKGYRVMAGWTSKEAGAICGMKASTYIAKDNGHREFTVSEAKTICSALNEKLGVHLSIDDIF